MDGRWTVKEVGSSIICGETMKDGRFFAFDIPFLDGIDIRRAPLKERIETLNRFSFLRPSRGNGAEFLQSVLSRGGEGVVVKYLNGSFDNTWFKCKRIETFDLKVSEKVLGKMSIRLSDSITGEDRGCCACFSEYDAIKTGMIVEISAFSMTAKGKLREPRFIRIRHDKTI